jgi:hypothetical protein
MTSVWFIPPHDDPSPKKPCMGGTEALAVEKEKLFSAAKAKVGKMGPAGCWPCFAESPPLLVG